MRRRVRLRACHARASNSRLTRSSWRTWPQRKLRRKVPSVDGALTRQSRTPAVPPARSASASSMQSPPAQRGGDQRHYLVAGVGPARRITQVQALLYQLGKTEVQGQGGLGGAGRHCPPGGDRRRRLGCGRGGCVVASIGCSFSGVGLPLQNHYPRFRGAPSCRFRTLTRPTPSVDSGLAEATRCVVLIRTEAGLPSPTNTTTGLANTRCATICSHWSSQAASSASLRRIKSLGLQFIPHKPPQPLPLSSAAFPVGIPNWRSRVLLSRTYSYT